MKGESIIPLGDRILVSPEPEMETTSTGLHLVPGAIKQETQTSEVLKVGDGVESKHIVVGAKVLHNKSAGTLIPDIEGEEDVKVLRYLDVIAVIE